MQDETRAIAELQARCERWKSARDGVAGARQALHARFPVALSDEVYADAFVLLRAKRKDWTVIRSFVARKVTKNVPRDGEAMRVKYSAWRKQMGNREPRRKSTA